MILVDTSVWVDHLRNKNNELEQLLNNGNVVCHQFIIGEIACGNIKNRSLIISLLLELPQIVCINFDEILIFIEKNDLIGKGLGFIDVHLLGSAVLHNVRLWTLDNTLSYHADRLGIGY
ncbi:MAG: type II toxin-antitoxin system VapC family toxin [Candidatus Hydrogenedentota bacterium]